jgi:hypothetical protein
MNKQKLLSKISSNKQAIEISVEKTKSTRGRKSVKEMSEGVALIEVPEDDILFQKMYYTIGKVADMFKVNQSLIRLWENEFDVLKPKKNGKGDRLFRPEDIKNIQLIYHLMRERNDLNICYNSKFIENLNITYNINNNLTKNKKMPHKKE